MLTNLHCVRRQFASHLRHQVPDLRPLWPDVLLCFYSNKQQPQSSPGRENKSDLVQLAKNVHLAFLFHFIFYLKDL